MARRARRELARKLDWHDEYDGPPADLPYEYSFVKLYCFSRQQLEVPRVRAQYAAVVLWMDLSGSEEGKQHDKPETKPDDLEQHDKTETQPIELGPEALVYPCFAGLPMGWAKRCDTVYEHIF